LDPQIVSDPLQACTGDQLVKIQLTNTSANPAVHLYNLDVSVALPSGVTFVPGSARVLEMTAQLSSLRHNRTT
jgi:uncharacterized repeat protein (TIGR01451 family)